VSDSPEQPVRPSDGVDQSHLPYPYQRLTRSGKILAVNEAWSGLLGYEAAAVTGDQFEEYVLQSDRADFRAAYEQFIIGERADPLELDLRHAAGHPMTVMFNVRTERSDDGAFVQAHCQFAAVSSSAGLGSVGTTEGRADEQFSATEERMQLAIEGAKLGIWDWDMQADEVLRDELLANMLGYSPAEMGDQLDDWERLVHPDGKQRHDEALAAHVANETDFYQCDYRMRTNAGDYKWVRTMGTVVAWDTDGAPLRAVGIHLDIDEQKRNQLKLARRTEQLEALNRVVRHDIRNDMNALYGWAQELEDHVDESGAEALEQVLTSAQHVLELTEVAREFVESLGVAEDVELEPVDLREHLRNELAKQRDAHPDADFEVVGDLSNATVRANEMLSSVFRNVLVNAVEHNDAVTPTVTVTATVRGQTVEVRIADNGPGIADDLKDDIFSKGTKGLSDGAGLGLYIVETLVDSYGGTVSIEDREKLRPTRSQTQADDDDSTGTVFIIELPLIDSDG